MADDSSIKKYLKYNILALKTLGLWSNVDFFKTKYYWKYTMVMNVAFVAVLNLCLGGFLVTNRDNMELFTTSFSSFSVCVLGNIKAFFYVKNEKLIKKVVKDLEDQEFQPKNSRQKEKCHSFLKIYYVTYLGFCTMTIVVTTLWILSPLFVKSSKILPILAWYPYNWSEKFYYEFSYLHQAIALYYIVLVELNIDLLICGLMSYIGVECDILSDTLENIYEFTASELAKRRGNGENVDVLSHMNKSLIRCTKHHLKILKFAEESSEFTNITIFAQFTGSLLTMCMQTFMLTVLSPGSPEFLKMLLFQSAVFGELFMYCWFGNEVIFKSSNIPTSLYKCAWLECPKEFKQNMLFFIRRSQKPIQLYAIDFFVISVPTFAAILRTSWSAFAVLRSVNDGE